MTLPSKFDNKTFDLARNHLNDFVERVSKRVATSGNRLLEVGPQERSEVRKCFKEFEIDTFDIVSDYSPTIIGDITKKNEIIKDSTYDVVTCLEVLEHTVNPFDAIIELRRILKDGGYLLVSAPLNWRIHGPVPDCWRFTEFGWRVLLKDFRIVELDKLETNGRNLFPIKYNLLAVCDKSLNVDASKMVFSRI